MGVTEARRCTPLRRLAGSIPYSLPAEDEMSLSAGARHMIGGMSCTPEPEPGRPWIISGRQHFEGSAQTEGRKHEIRAEGVRSSSAGARPEVVGILLGPDRSEKARGRRLSRVALPTEWQSSLSPSENSGFPEAGCRRDSVVAGIAWRIVGEVEGRVFPPPLVYTGSDGTHDFFGINRVPFLWYHQNSFVREGFVGRAQFF